MTREQIANRYYEGNLLFVKAGVASLEHNLVVASYGANINVTHISADGRPVKTERYCTYSVDPAYQVADLKIVDGAVLITDNKGRTSVLDLKVGVFREICILENQAASRENTTAEAAAAICAA